MRANGNQKWGDVRPVVDLYLTCSLEFCSLYTCSAKRTGRWTLNVKKYVQKVKGQAVWEDISGRSPQIYEKERQRWRETVLRRKLQHQLALVWINHLHSESSPVHLPSACWTAMGGPLYSVLPSFFLQDTQGSVHYYI